MKCSLGISNLLEEIASLSYSIVFLYFFALISEENNRMGKTRDHFKKIRDTKGAFYAKMGSIKDRNDRDLTKAEDITKRWQEYTEELYKKRSSQPR